MTVEVRLFAVARQSVGRPSVLVDVPDPATVGGLRRTLAAAYPPLARLLEGMKMAVAVDSEYASDDFEIPPGAEVALIPPVSGGAAR